MDTLLELVILLGIATFVLILRRNPGEGVYKLKSVLIGCIGSNVIGIFSFNGWHILRRKRRKRSCFLFWVGMTGRGRCVHFLFKKNDLFGICLLRNVFFLFRWSWSNSSYIWISKLAFTWIICVYFCRRMCYTWKKQWMTFTPETADFLHY